MTIQGSGGKRPAGSDLDAAQVKRLAHWSLRQVLPRVPCPGPDRADWKQELTAQAYLAACRAIREFDSERGVGLPVFVRERIRGAARTMQRRERSRRQRLARDGRERLADIAAPPASAGYPLMAPQLPAAMNWLPPDQKKLLLEVYWEDRSATDIAAEAGVTKQAVSLRVQAARRALRAELRALARGQGRHEPN